MKEKIIFLVILFLISILLFSETAFAQRKLELKYPSLPKIGAIQAETKIEQFLAYFYHLLITIVGFIALGVMIHGGVLWLISAGNPAQIAEAKEKILSGFVGLLILLGSYLILFTINPQLTFLSTQIPKPKGLEEKLAGVYFCKKECSKGDIKCITNPENCVRLDGGQIPPEYQGENLKGIHFLRPAYFPYFYLRLFADKAGQNQECSVMLGENYLDGSQIRGEVSPKEATYIDVGKFPGYQPVKGGVKFCERVGTECEKGKIWGPYSPDLGEYINLAKNISLDKVKAMLMEGEFFVVLFQEKNYRGKCYSADDNVLQLGANFMFDRDENYSPYAKVGSLIMIPLKRTGVEIKTESKKSTDLETQISLEGIEIKPGVSLEGVRGDTLEAIFAFKKKYQIPDGAIVITSGSEGYHHSTGRLSHKNGYKLDLRLNSTLDNIIEKNFLYVGERKGDFGGPKYQRTINSWKMDFTKEINPPKDPKLQAQWAPHWDLLVTAL